MRLVFVVLALSCLGWSQALTEAAAAAAGGSVGGVAGKKVSDGVVSVFEKVAGTAAKAADAKPATTKPVATQPATAAPVAAPALQVGPGAPRKDRSLVPPPPPIHRAAVKLEIPPLPPPVEEAIAPPPPLPPPPPPEVTPADLQTLTNGMGRLAVLKLGAPASRVSMADGGHLVEIYRYANRDMSFGVVKLSDGVVSSVEVLHP